MNLSGIFLALTTPFDESGDVSPELLRANVALYDKTPVSGYLANGSTGESVFLDRAEMEIVLEAVRDGSAPGRTLIAGTGVEATAETISRTEVAAKLGYDCALIQMPSYFKPVLKPDVYVEHYRRVADASRIPILLYSVPQFTGVAMEPELVARLAEHPNIVGMKDSSGNVARLGEIVAAAPASFKVLTGSGTSVYASMVSGATGAILALADFLPELCVELYKAAASNDARVAPDLQRRVMPASKRVVSALGIAGIKYAMDRRGYHGGIPRQPLPPLTAAQKQEVESVLSTLTPAAAAR